jgi:hypothetical protein
LGWGVDVRLCSFKRAAVRLIHGGSFLAFPTVISMIAVVNMPPLYQRLPFI